MKKTLKIALFSVLGLVVVAGVLVWMEFGSLIKGAMSCEKLDEGMYYMEYEGDDGLRISTFWPIISQTSCQKGISRLPRLTARSCQ